MNAKKKFKRVYDKMPDYMKARVAYMFWDKPINMNVCWEEIKNDTYMGIKILNELGFKDD